MIIDDIRMFPKIVVPQNGWFIMENPIKNGWFGGTTIFGNTHTYPSNPFQKIWLSPWFHHFLKTPPLLFVYLPSQSNQILRIFGPPPVRWRNSSPPHGCNVQIHSVTRLTRSATCANSRILLKMCFSYITFGDAKKTSNLFVVSPVKRQLSGHRTLKCRVLDLQRPPPPARWPRHFPNILTWIVKSTPSVVGYKYFLEV